MLDKKDLRILKILMKNGRTKVRDIARTMKIPVTTVHKRIKNLENDRVILNYVANIDYEKLGYHILAFVLVKVNYIEIKKLKSNHDNLADRILEKFPAVDRASIITGPQRDILLRIREKSVNDLNKFIHRLRDTPGVLETDTLLVLYDIEQTGERRIDLLI